MESLGRDIQFSLRTFAKNPGFTTVAVLSLALGIGANTTIFTLINSVFLNPLPVKNPSELVGIYTVDANNPGQFSNLNPVSYKNYQDFRDQNQVFTGLAYYSFPFAASVSRGGEPMQIFTEMVTGNYFDVLGVHPARGRFFLPEEDQTPGTNPVVVMSYGLWQRVFGGKASVIGRTLRVNGHTYTVVRIGPAGLQGRQRHRRSRVVGPDDDARPVPARPAPRLLRRAVRPLLQRRGAAPSRGDDGAGRGESQDRRRPARARVPQAQRGPHRIPPCPWPKPPSSQGSARSCSRAASW
jgi:hypothetical protein